jgi:hypothetical protein
MAIISIKTNKKYSDSEKFRAQLYLLLGTVLSTPISILVLEKMKSNSSFEQKYWIISFILLLFGLTSILNSYSIMVEKDEVTNV